MFEPDVEVWNRLLLLTPCDMMNDPENAGWEFGYYIFESLPKLSSKDVVWNRLLLLTPCDMMNELLL